MNFFCRAVLTMAPWFIAGATVAQESAVPTQDEAVAAQRVPAFHLGSVGDDAASRPDPFGAGEANFRTTLLQLRDAAADSEITGLRLYVDGGLDLPHATEVLRELRRLKAKGKKIVCYAEALNRNSLLFASLADHLAIPPSGGVELLSFDAEVLYFHDLLEQMGVRFEVLHIGDFKTAFEEFAKSQMSAEQRLSLQQMFEELYRTTVSTIAGNRGIDCAVVEQGFAEMMLDADQALAMGLIDAVSYADEFEANCEQVFGADVEFEGEYGAEGDSELEEMLNSPMGAFAMLGKLLNPPEEQLPEGPCVAVVYANGAIMSGASSAGLQGQTMGSDTIVEALETVGANDDVAAVVLRVNSPGGSALASDMIWRAIEEVKTKKPVIASMGDVAASGGYWISMGCNKIFAQPTTITGSIGVVSAVPSFAPVLERFGVRVEQVGAGPRVGEFSSYAGVSDHVRGKLVSSMEAIYSDFLNKVAVGRSLDRAVVAEHAQGRVWTGRQAKEIGLVDVLGGLDEAIAYACAVSGLDTRETPVIEYPAPPDFLAALEETLGGFARAHSPVRSVLRELGLEDLALRLELIRAAAHGDVRDRIQAVMPFEIRIR